MRLTADRGAERPTYQPASIPATRPITIGAIGHSRERVRHGRQHRQGRQVHDAGQGR
jgi:hypothetical protein